MLNVSVEMIVYFKIGLFESVTTHLHGVVGIFVVELEDLEVVVEAASVLGVLDALVERQQLRHLEELGTLLRAPSVVFDHPELAMVHRTLHTVLYWKRDTWLSSPNNGHISLKIPEGGVHVGGPDEVDQVEGVDSAVPLEVVHIEGELDG